MLRRALGAGRAGEPQLPGLRGLGREPPIPRRILTGDTTPDSGPGANSRRAGSSSAHQEGWSSCGRPPPLSRGHRARWGAPARMGILPPQLHPCCSPKLPNRQWRLQTPGPSRNRGGGGGRTADRPRTKGLSAHTRKDQDPGPTGGPRGGGGRPPLGPPGSDAGPLSLTSLTGSQDRGQDASSQHAGVGTSAGDPQRTGTRPRQPSLPFPPQVSTVQGPGYQPTLPEPPPSWRAAQPSRPGTRGP